GGGDSRSQLPDRGLMQSADTRVYFADTSIAEEIGHDFYNELLISSGSNIGAYELEIGFNPVELEVISIEVSDYLGAGDRILIPVARDFDNEFGKLTVALASFGSDPGATGDGLLLRIDWRSLSNASAKITINHLQLTDVNGTAIPASTGNGQINRIPQAFTVEQNYPNPFN
ncbi:MAG: hypothetical protein GY869_19805, partial [Planctomycetes bacterium]|nr:hypothetical protein [Planctomycetota bacterium]